MWRDGQAEAYEEDERGEFAANAQGLAFSTPDPLEDAAIANERSGVILSVVNGAFRLAGRSDESVPGCAVHVADGAVSGSTNSFGNVQLDLTGLEDGWHKLEIIPPLVSADEPGPGFPLDPGVERIWRPFVASLHVQEGAVIDAHGAGVEVGDARIVAPLTPVWLRTIGATKRDAPLDTLVVHHTGGNSLARDLRHLVASGEASANYVIGCEGTIFKLAPDDHYTWHAGYSWWANRDGLNRSSLGIEIVHATGSEYPERQLRAVTSLVQSLVTAYDLPRNRVVGHSDIATNRPEHRPPTLLGRKSTDPGSAFPWEQFEALGLGMIPSPGVPPVEMYGSIFQKFPMIALREGDNDATRTYGGAVRSEITASIVAAVQADLAELGYWCLVDGDFGRITARAVQMFQEHVFSGSRRRGHDPWNSGDGRFDIHTARMLRRMRGETPPALLG